MSDEGERTQDYDLDSVPVSAADAPRGGCDVFFFLQRGRHGGRGAQRRTARRKCLFFFFFGHGMHG